MDLQGRVVVVTGAGSGLGRMILRGFAERGAEVVAADRDATSAREAAAAAGAAGRAPAHWLEVDVCVAADCERLVAAARKLGGPQVLVNNAGGWASKEQFPDAGVAGWSATLDLNLRAPMLLTQLCLAPMAALGEAAVVNIASTAGLGHDAYAAPEYAAAKAGLIRFTSSLGDPATTGGARVTCVVPDWIGLPRAHDQWAALSAEERSGLPPLIPPADVVDTVLGLVRDDSPSGTIVELRGGAAPRVIPASPGGDAE